MIFTHPSATDLEEIMYIENAGFTFEQAASQEAMKKRIEIIPDSFIIAKQHERIVGYIVGPVIEQRYIDDSLFQKTSPNPLTGGIQSILSLAVHPDFRKQQIASQLLQKLEENSYERQRTALTLTCLESLIPFYEKSGFINEGESSSTHGNVIWYNLVKNLINESR